MNEKVEGHNVTKCIKSDHFASFQQDEVRDFVALMLVSDEILNQARYASGQDDAGFQEIRVGLYKRVISSCRA
ncbi:MAG TPA: hypothetical protein VLO29_08830 [Salegentibacter sp.]|nr:hypothetical protein [Salegentibacter sp.]